MVRDTAAMENRDAARRTEPRDGSRTWSRPAQGLEAGAGEPRQHLDPRRQKQGDAVAVFCISHWVGNTLACTEYLKIAIEQLDMILFCTLFSPP